MPALRPDVTVIHAQQADRRGNVGMWGITGVQREAVLAAATAIVTVEEVVDELSPVGPNHVVLPTWTVTAVAEVPHGSHPSVRDGVHDPRQRLLPAVGPGVGATAMPSCDGSTPT